jgi:hypothetical protein
VRGASEKQNARAYPLCASTDFERLGRKETKLFKASK